MKPPEIARLNRLFSPFSQWVGQDPYTNTKYIFRAEKRKKNYTDISLPRSDSAAHSPTSSLRRPVLVIRLRQVDGYGSHNEADYNPQCIIVHLAGVLRPYHGCLQAHRHFLYCTIFLNVLVNLCFTDLQHW